MFKLLLILALTLYILTKLGNWLFRPSQGSQHQSRQQRPEGSIRVDRTPGKGRKSSIKGGEYVDYEEVK